MISICGDDVVHLWNIRQKPPDIVHSLHFKLPFQVQKFRASVCASLHLFALTNGEVCDLLAINVAFPILSIADSYVMEEGQIPRCFLPF
ncbi:unnamed protein product [Hydatigera taeniaeformis]|uniref:Uncharacterized protein n=1 Tax=Hydatigena taeniaeformis TaxID=6205 RepID=A0A3P7G4N5_HYDTA|nr:unnamed protein product [Hydatigera taeniaeformis]